MRRVIETIESAISWTVMGDVAVVGQNVPRKVIEGEVRVVWQDMGWVGTRELRVERIACDSEINRESFVAMRLGRRARDSEINWNSLSALVSHWGAQMFSGKLHILVTMPFPECLQDSAFAFAGTSLLADDGVRAVQARELATIARGCIVAADLPLVALI